MHPVANMSVTLEEIKQWLDVNGKTQKELAEEIGVNPAYLRSVLSGCAKFSNRLNVKIEKRMNGKGGSLIVQIPDIFDEKIYKIADATGETPEEVVTRIIATVLSLNEPTK